MHKNIGLATKVSLLQQEFPQMDIKPIFLNHFQVSICRKWNVAIFFFSFLKFIWMFRYLQICKLLFERSNLSRWSLQIGSCSIVLRLVYLPSFMICYFIIPCLTHFFSIHFSPVLKLYIFSTGKGIRKKCFPKYWSMLLM